MHWAYMNETLRVEALVMARATFIDEYWEFKIIQDI